MLEVDVAVAESGEELSHLSLLFGCEAARAVVEAVVGTIAAEHGLEPFAQGRGVAHTHLVEQAGESPCRSCHAQQFEVWTVVAGGCGEDGVAAGAGGVEDESSLIAYARVAQRATRCEAVEPCGGNVAARDGCSKDICVFHDVVFCVCIVVLLNECKVTSWRGQCQ